MNNVPESPDCAPVDWLINVAFENLCSEHFNNGDPKQDREIAVTVRQWKKKKLEMSSHAKKSYILEWYPWAYKENEAEKLVNLRFRNAIPIHQLCFGLPFSTVIEHQRATLCFLTNCFEKELDEAPRISKDITNKALLTSMCTVLDGFHKPLINKALIMDRYPIEFLNLFIKSKFTEGKANDFIKSVVLAQTDYQETKSPELLELVENVCEQILSAANGACITL